MHRRVYAADVCVLARNRWGLALIVAALGGSLGCSSPESPLGDSEDTSSSSGTEGEPGEFEPLIDHMAWTQLDAVADPLADHRPTAVDCGLAGWYVENPDQDNEALEIDTNFCNYLAVGQPSLATITEGRGVRLGFYYFDLKAPEPAVAHVAVLVDGVVLWELDVDIPGDAKVYDLEFPAPFSAPVGAEVVFHLHNHGQNTWQLQSIEAEQS